MTADKIILSILIVSLIVLIYKNVVHEKWVKQDYILISMMIVCTLAIIYLIT